MHLHRHFPIKVFKHMLIGTAAHIDIDRGNQFTYISPWGMRAVFKSLSTRHQLEEPLAKTAGNSPKEV